MLVLSRKVGQAFLIDGRILVRIQQIRGGQVSIGIEAPKEIAIVREELVAEMARARPAGAPGPSTDRLESGLLSQSPLAKGGDPHYSSVRLPC